MKKITIGSAVYNDPQGIWYTYQSIRLNNKDILDDIELVVIDNNPKSPEGKDTENICSKLGIKYIPYDKKRSTAVRNEIFKHSTAPFCFSIDSHVLFEPNTIKRLIRWTESNPNCEDLLQGPMLHDSLNPNNRDMSTHMNPTWRAHMFGVWGFDDRAVDMNNEPFEIEMHGLGLFGCKTDTWLGFHDLFKGFGGEEGYIHEKYRKNGRKTLCLPFLRWLHKFRLSDKPPYPLPLSERISNYIVGHLDNELPLDEIEEHFSTSYGDYLNLVEEVKTKFEIYNEVPMLLDDTEDVNPTIEKGDINQYSFRYSAKRQLPFVEFRVTATSNNILPITIDSFNVVYTNKERGHLILKGTDQKSYNFLIEEHKKPYYFEVQGVEMVTDIEFNIICPNSRHEIYIEGSVGNNIFIPVLECK